jgi:hypothetical protein
MYRIVGAHFAVIYRLLIGITFVIVYCSILSGLGAPACVSSSHLLLACGIIEKTTRFLGRGLQ